MTCRIPSPVLEYGNDPTAVLLKDEHQPGISYCVLEQMRRRSQFCDVEIKMKNNARLQAHKAVLASSSPYFMKLLSADVTKTEISLTDSRLDINALEMLIDFIYTSVLRISEHTVQPLCRGAKLLQLVRIERACSKFMENNLKKQTCVSYLIFGKENGYDKLKLASQKFIAEHITTIADDPSFQDLDTKDLLDILACEHLSLPSEDALFDLLLTWVEHEPESRQKELNHLVSSIKCNLPNLRELREVVKSPDASDLNGIRECFKKLKQNTSTNSESLTIDPALHTYDNVSIMLYAVGGVTPESTTSLVEKYDFRGSTWVHATRLPKKKSHAALVSVRDSLYSLGGFDGNKRLSSVHIFDPSRDTWSKGPSMPETKSDFGAVFDGEKHIYCIGGYASSADTDSVNILDTKTQKWRDGPSLNQMRSYVQAAMVDGEIYAVGGVENNKRLKTVEKLNIKNGSEKWELVASLNIPRSRPGVASLEGHIYAVGGYSGSEHLKSVERYDPEIDRWTLIECMSVPRNSPAIAICAGCLYAAGGHDGKKLLNSVEFYDPEKKQWGNMPPMSLARCDFSMAALAVSGPTLIGTWM